MTVQGFTKWGMPCEIELDSQGNILKGRNYIHGELTPEQIEKPILVTTER